MGASLDRIRGEMNVKPTGQDKGITLTMTVTAYDNGMVVVNGTPINCQPNYDQGHGWLSAAEIIIATLGEFRKLAATRRRRLGK